MSSIEMTVDGNLIQFDENSELVIGDVSEDMNKVAAQMAYWGSIWAAAEQERILIEVHYRQWKAKVKFDILASQPKLAEWKVQTEMQTMPEYGRLYTAQAAAVRNATLAKSIFESHRIKANMLQSKGAMMRSELDSTDMKTPKEPKKIKRMKKTESHVDPNGTANRLIKEQQLTKMKNMFGKKKGEN